MRIVGAVLYQGQNSQTCCCISRLFKIEQNYLAHKFELLALKWAITWMQMLFILPVLMMSLRSRIGK